jgi:hypothetical protein
LKNYFQLDSTDQQGKELKNYSQLDSTDQQDKESYLPG